RGNMGTLLLDPSDIDIKTAIANDDVQPAVGALGGTTFDDDPGVTTDPSVLAVSVLQTALGLGNVVVTTTSAEPGGQLGIIRVQNNVVWPALSPNSLTLTADNKVEI